MTHNSVSYKCDRCGKVTNSGELINYPLQNVVTFAGVAMLNTSTSVNLCRHCADMLCPIINKFIIEDFIVMESEE